MTPRRRHLQSVPPPADGYGPGTWVVASKALRRPVTVDEAYPHVCGTQPGKDRLTRSTCWACLAVTSEQVA